MSSSRRKFLCLTLGAGAALGAGARLWRAVPEGWQRRTRTAWALGSHVSVTLAHHRLDELDEALDAAFAELEQVDALMSLYRPDSQLSRMNRDGRLENPHPLLTAVLRDSVELSRRTDGAFDVTVQPLWGLYARAEKSRVAPDPDELARTLRRVNWRQIQMSPTAITLQAGAEITLNGIAQGFAADRARQALQDRGIEHALVDTGEIATRGGNETGSAWTVGIQHPRQPDAFLSLARLAGRCLATSGDYATPFRADYQDHHIFDPRTGHSPTQLASVSVAAPTAMQADGLSTAVFVLGVERGWQLIRAIAETDALLVLKDGSVLATANFPSEATA